MKRHSSRGNSKGAFTLTELLAIMATVGLMAALALPALAHAKIKSPAAGCISTLRQMMVGWEMYKEDNNDSLMPNAPAGQALGQIWVGGTEDWHNAAGNTNLSYYTNALLAPYVGNDVRVFKCPADVVLSDNGQRLRSRSMNGQMGPETPSVNYNTGWPQYLKGSDLTCPTPANAWVWCDESPYSLNDGFLQVNLLAPDYPDVPANYHGNACGFSFADGHAEEHRWTSSFITSVRVSYGVTGTHWPSSVQDTDYIWLYRHTACKQLP